MSLVFLPFRKLSRPPCLYYWWQEIQIRKVRWPPVAREDRYSYRRTCWYHTIGLSSLKNLGHCDKNCASSHNCVLFQYHYSFSRLKTGIAGSNSALTRTWPILSCDVTFATIWRSNQISLKLLLIRMWRTYMKEENIDDIGLMASRKSRLCSPSSNYRLRVFLLSPRLSCPSALFRIVSFPSPFLIFY